MQTVQILRWLLRAIGCEHSARLCRRSFRRGLATVKHGSLRAAPILFGNSFPKSGTFLLKQVLVGFTGLGPVVDSGFPVLSMFDQVKDQRRPIRAIRADLARLRAGDIVMAHLAATAEIISDVCRSGVAAFFMLRDPRDVAVSQVHYLTDIGTHHRYHRHYRYELQDFDARLRSVILGHSQNLAVFPDIGTRLARICGWLGRDDVLVVRFEDLIQRREETLGSIFDHVVARGLPCQIERSRAVPILAESIDPKRSPTFRRGQIGGWREEFTAEHKALFKEVAGDILIELGYERDRRW